MDRRPEWVPEWIWGAHLHHIEWHKQYQTEEQPWLDLETSLLLDPDCATVWQAIDRRKGEPSRRMRAHGRQHPTTKDEAIELFREVGFSSGHIPPAKLIPASERKKTGAKIANLAFDLAGELHALEACTGLDDYPFLRATASVASVIANDSAKAGNPADHEYTDHTLEGWDDFSYGVMVGVDNIEATLLAIGNAAKQWAETQPAIVRPNSENARRLYFMREMTKYFRRWYGTPLRDTTAALTRCIFACEMDAATVAKLAP